MLNTFYTLLALLACVSSAVMFVAMCYAAGQCSLDTAAMLEAEETLDAACDAAATVAQWLVRDFGTTAVQPAAVQPAASETFAARGPLLHVPSMVATLPPPALEAADLAEALEVVEVGGPDMLATLASEPARPSGVWLVAERMATGRALSTGRAPVRPTLDWSDGSACAFLAGHTVRTPRGRLVPATIALYRVGARPGGLRQRMHRPHAA